MRQFVRYNKAVRTNISLTILIIVAQDLLSQFTCDIVDNLKQHFDDDDDFPCRDTLVRFRGFLVLQFKYGDYVGKS